MAFRAAGSSRLQIASGVRQSGWVQCASTCPYADLPHRGALNRSVASTPPALGGPHGHRGWHTRRAVPRRIRCPKVHGSCGGPENLGRFAPLKWSLRPDWRRQPWRLGHGGRSGRFTTRSAENLLPSTPLWIWRCGRISLFDVSQLAVVGQARRGTPLCCLAQQETNGHETDGVTGLAAAAIRRLDGAGRKCERTKRERYSRHRGSRRRSHCGCAGRRAGGVQFPATIASDKTWAAVRTR